MRNGSVLQYENKEFIFEFPGKYREPFAKRIVVFFMPDSVYSYFITGVSGVNGLFGNILTVLNLAELGVGSAIIFYIYKPIAEEDVEGQIQLMNLYKILYRCIAGFIAVAGVALVPFLDYLIKDQPDIQGLTVIYLLYLFNTVSSYLFSYKRSIIDAAPTAVCGNYYYHSFYDDPVPGSDADSGFDPQFYRVSSGSDYL